jgi:TatD DNase family protein
METTPADTRPFMLTDAHIHLQDAAFDPDRRTVLEAARKSGVSRFICAATAPDDWEKTLGIARDDASVVPFLGTHPWYADRHDPQRLESLLSAVPECGVGEIGLDSLRLVPGQEDVFSSQLALAARLNRPCTIHCVRAFDVLLPCLKRKPLPPVFLCHSFGGTEQDMKFLLERGGYFSFSGAALRPNRTKAHEMIRAVPPERLLIETDAPDMKPPAGFCVNAAEPRNVPANLSLIVRGIAAFKGMDAEELGFLTADNARRFEKGLP